MNRINLSNGQYAYLILAVFLDALLTAQGQAQTPGVPATKITGSEQVIVVPAPAIVRIERSQKPVTRRPGSKPTPSQADLIRMLVDRISVRPPAARRCDILEKASKQFDGALTFGERCLVQAAAEGYVADFDSPPEQGNRCDPSQNRAKSESQQAPVPALKSPPPDHQEDCSPQADLNRTGPAHKAFTVSQNGVANCSAPQHEAQWNGWVGTDLLQWLLTDEDLKPDLDPRGVLLKNAQIGSVLRSGRSGNGGDLHLEHLVLTAPLVISNSTFHGDIDLRWAQTRTLDFNGSTIMGRLDAHRLRIERGDLILHHARIYRGVELSDADIDGAINGQYAALCYEKKEVNNQASSSADPDNGQGNAEECSCRHSFDAQHLVTHDQVEFTNAVSDGGFDLLGSKIGGNLLFNEVNVMGAPDCHSCGGNKARGNYVLNASFATVSGTLLWTPQKSDHGPDAGCGRKQRNSPSVNLAYAKVSAYVDRPDSWPDPGQLRIIGFTYNNIVNGVQKQKLYDKCSRCEWLRLQTSNDRLVKQPYLQLSSVLKASGAEYNAEAVLIDHQYNLMVQKFACQAMFLKQWYKNSCEFAGGSGMKNPPFSLSSIESWAQEFWSFCEFAFFWAIWLTAGFGYQPQRALLIGAFLVGVGWIIFKMGYLRGLIIPTSQFDELLKKRKLAQPGVAANPGFKNVSLSSDEIRLLTAPDEAFYPAIYALEKLVPLVRLSQADRWRPDPNSQGFGAWLVKACPLALQFVGLILSFLYAMNAATLLWLF